MSLAGFIIALVAGIALILLSLLNLIDGLWRLPATVWVRGWWTLLPTALLAGLIVGGSLWLAPGLGPIAVAMAIMLVVPWPAAHLIGLIGRWLLDSEDTWKRAAEIRRELRERHDGAGRVPTGYWPEYVFDVERARRRDEYEPPPL